MPASSSLQATHLLHLADRLEAALSKLVACPDAEAGSEALFRSLATRNFELALEHSGKLLRKALRLYGGSPREVDHLPFQDLLRQAGKHGLLDVEGVSRWLAYHQQAGATPTEDEVGCDGAVLALLPAFWVDLRALAHALQRLFDAHPSVPGPGPLALDLRPEDLRLLQGLLARHVPQAEAWAYGSRVVGGAQPCSDLDLVLRQPGRLDEATEGFDDLKEALSASLIPITVDLHDWAWLPEAHRRNVEGAHLVLWRYCRGMSGVNEGRTRPLQARCLT